jgi:hypothetical protein
MKQADVDEAVATMARLAGLQKALEEFPADVALAAQDAARAVAELVTPADPTLEPWPPMRARDDR